MPLTPMPLRCRCKFQLGPHIAENVVPSLTVTDSRTREAALFMVICEPYIQ